MALSFNARDAGKGQSRGGERGAAPPMYVQAPWAPTYVAATTYPPGNGGHGCGRGCGQGSLTPPPPFNPGGFSPDGTFAPPGGRFQPGYANPPPPTAGGQHNMYGCAPHGGIPPQGATQAAPYSNVVKRFVNWNTCVCVDLLTSGESLYHDWVSTQRPAFSHYLEAALSRI